ncbi:PREDICTED: uncharacterized protein LOC109585291 [Amphimedon queenslandica]|uniref:F-box domain-containing protein n=1 Tax=Amphimedon queenslandica TaxID=400682 RepID=A0A1X7TZH0_AMPQE|nr:PREDICTED: uncharacterized protein LOC109585291 [Amphimedon queenslandica]|eukprot:XP_019856857.1 PREDICTED: uncharacterized protein LOC109585291 [Amphimedon queenslandica]
MASLKTLLSIWDLQEDDENIRELFFSSKSNKLSSEFCSSQDLKGDTFLPDLEPCPSCNSLNSSKSSWCTECGKSLLGEEGRRPEQQPKKKQEGDFAQNLLLDDIPIDSHRSSLELDIMIDSSSTTSSYCNGYTYERKWGSSSRYHMWQKPSSLKKLSVSSIPDYDTEMNTPAIDSNSITAQEQPLTVSFIDLPNEILLFILSFLSPLDVAAFGLVCTRFRQISMLDYRKTIVLRGSLTKCRLKEATMLQPSILVLKNCKASSLSVAEIDKGISYIGNRLKRLVVDMCDMGSSGSNGLLSAVAHYCPSLTSLELHWTFISGSHLLQVVKACKSLEELCLTDVSGISLKEWHKVIKRLALLKHFHDLSVALCPEVPLTAFLLSSQPLLSLRSLKIRQNINKVTVEDIHALLTDIAPNIAFIKLECIEADEEVLQYIESKGIGLQLDVMVN